MLRFTTAVVTNAAQRTLVTAAMLLGSRARAAVSFSRDGLERTRASDVAAGGNLRVGTMPRTSARNGQTLEERVAAIEAYSASQKADLDDMNLEIASLKEDNELLREKAFQLGSREQNAALEAKLKQLERALAVDKKLAIVADALEIVDENFQHQFNTGYSLHRIWGTPEEHCDEEAKRALQGFLEATEQCLPQALRMKFFLAWRSVREQREKRCHISIEDVRQLTPHNLKAALDVCCAEFGDDVRASLLKVIVSSMKRKGMMYATAPRDWEASRTCATSALQTPS